MSARRRGIENLSIITNVDSFETLLEQYFAYHSNFLWDRAKEFLESEREKLKARHPNCGTSIIAALFHALFQLNLAEKNYMQLQFFSQKFLQRKDIVKLGYSSLKYDFQQLEQRGSLMTQKTVSVAATQTSPIHLQTSQSAASPISTHTKCLSTVLNRTPSSSVENSPGSHVPESEVAQDVLDCTMEELFQPEDPLPVPQPSVSRPQRPLEESQTPPTKSSSPGFFSKLFRFSSRSSGSPFSSLKPLQEIDYDVTTNDPGSKECQDNHLELESIEKFAAHVAGQLVNYVSMRIEMILWFETLADMCSGSFCLVDGCIQMLHKIQQDAEQNFHHPVLSPLKIMFYFECDILLGLLNLHTTIQNFKYLESLFYLQDAHNKLNLISTLRDQMIAQVTGGNNTTGSSGSSGTGFQEKLRRNITSSSLSSSIGSSTGISSGSLQVPPISAGLTSAVSGVPSPSGLTNTTFVYPYPSTGIYIQPKFTQRHNSFQSMPPLFQWLNRLKQFLLSKYSFYFHTVLTHHLASASSQNAQDVMKTLLTKLSYDFHYRNVNFLKKYDNTQLVLLFDTHERECNLHGYSSPFTDRPQPQGVSTIPIVYSHPGEFPMARLPSLIMIMDEKIQELNACNHVVVIDCDKQRPLSGGGGHMPLTNNNNHLTYFLLKPDPDFTFALICEGNRKPERDVAQMITFLQDTCSLLKGTKIFTNIKTSAK